MTDDIVALLHHLADRFYNWPDVSDDLLKAAATISRLRAEIERLRAENAAWMNGVADAVEPLGYDRDAACGPADLLPGLKDLVPRPRPAAGGDVVIGRLFATLLAVNGELVNAAVTRPTVLPPGTWRVTVHDNGTIERVPMVRPESVFEVFSFVDDEDGSTGRGMRPRPDLWVDAAEQGDDRG